VIVAIKIAIIAKVEKEKLCESEKYVYLITIKSSTLNLLRNNLREDFKVRDRVKKFKNKKMKKEVRFSLCRIARFLILNTFSYFLMLSHTFSTSTSDILSHSFSYSSPSSYFLIFDISLADNTMMLLSLSLQYNQLSHTFSYYLVLILSQPQLLTYFLILIPSPYFLIFYVAPTS